MPKLNKTDLELKLNSTQTVDYPYDSAMVDNIGHRSRVLLYVKDDSKSEKSEVEAVGEKSTETIRGKAILFINSSAVTIRLQGKDLRFLQLS